MADFNAIANAFTGHYYRTFDNAEARNGLSSLYRPESMLTWEGQQFQGTQGIIAQLTKPELKVVKHAITSVDSQPSSGSGVQVLVTGSLAIDNAFDKPIQFVDSFMLAPIPGQAGGFYVNNQIFRLIIQ